LGGSTAHTLEEIGALYDLTRERVRQIKEKGIRRLKHASRSKILKAYLG
jgi:RNA polymerase primary sigma factor